MAILTKTWEERLDAEDIDWINSRLKKYPEEINIRLDTKFTPLIYAVHDNLNVNFIRFLLEKGADVDATSRYEDTAFYWAVLNDEIEIVKLLIEYGTNIHHKRDERNAFDIHLSPEMFRFLLSIGVSIEDGIEEENPHYETVIMKFHYIMEDYLEERSPKFIRWFKGKRMEVLF
jgi:hypothetical protein